MSFGQVKEKGYERKKGRKGLFFTLDALLAASVLILGFIIALQAEPSTLSTDLPFENLHFESEDSLEVMALTKFKDLPNATLKDELLNITELDDTDLEKSTLDVVTYLWATNNATHAKRVVETMLNNTLPGGRYYNLSIRDIDGTETLILNKTPTASLETIKTSSSTRLISGFKTNATTKGHVARAFAKKVETNNTIIFPINPEGSGHTANNDALIITKKFYIPVASASNISKGTIFISMHSGTPATTHGEFRINGAIHEFGDLDGLIDEEQDNTHLIFGSEVITNDLVARWNTLEIRQKSNQFHSHVHPGARIEVTYSGNGSIENRTLRSEKHYFDKIFSQRQGSQKSGVWAIMPAYVPSGTTVNKAMLYLNFSGITDNNQKDDIQIYFNGVSIHNITAPSSDQNVTVNLTSNMSSNIGKTNVISVFANVFFANASEDDDEDDDDTFWGNSDLTMISDPQNNANGSSRLELEYTPPANLSIYGKIAIIKSEQFEGPRSNPKTYPTNFSGYEARDVFLHIAEIGNLNVTAKVNHSGQAANVIFQTPMGRSTPTKVAVGIEHLNLSNVSNTFNVSDSCSVCGILGNSSVEYAVYVPGQVGYGKSFNTADEAKNDAEKRLNETLEDFANIIETDITSQRIGTQNIPYKYGPIRAILRVWSE